MEFKNEYIVISIIIMITIFFIINYDVYVISKNEPLCKPVYITKKIIDDKMISKLKNPKESFKIKKNKDVIDDDNIIDDDKIQEEKNNEKIQEEIKNNQKKIRKKMIINNILNILSKIPTVLNNDEIYIIINHISNIYLNSNTMDEFYKNINSSDKISSKNLNYSKLILYLIDNFDSSIPFDSIPMENKNIINEENKNITNEENKNITNEENIDNIFLISNSNSPIHSRMIQQANFIR